MKMLPQHDEKKFGIPPLNPEYTIDLSSNPAYVFYSLKTVILCKNLKNLRLRTVYSMCCLPRTMPLRTGYALKRPES